MNQISFISANFVARETGYQMTKGWMQGDRATNEYFRPLETFASRFEELLTSVNSLGFRCVDLWTGHLNWKWATEEHLKIARELIEAGQLTVTGYAGGFGATREEFDSACRTAAAIGAKTLAGTSPFAMEHRAEAVEILTGHNVQLGLENHPEKNAAALLEQIGDGAGGRIGAALDTGWFGTQGYAASKAIRELGSHLLQVHLKDVREAGAHSTCVYEEGCVDIPACVNALKSIGYQGPICVEHEPELQDPSEDCKKNLALLRQWLA